MKCVVRCESLLLKKSVEIFLRPYVSSYHEADIVIADAPYETTKPLLVIKPPFSKDQLLEQVDYALECYEREEERRKAPKWSDIEPKIEKLTSAYMKKLMEIVQEHYERK